MKSVSTYPVKRLPDNSSATPTATVREGDPNADHFAIDAMANRVVAAIADGCGWGQGPHLASLNATKKFVEYFRDNHLLIKNTKDVGIHLLNAVNAANNEVVRQQEDSPGTTTLLGGILLQANKQPHVVRWLYAFINIGDCKVFRWSSQNNFITDLTAGNRSAFMATDPGGRLGPGDSLDVRNISLSYTECDEGDIIFMLSDGVHDNGPASQGLTPNELDATLPNDWKDVPQDKINTLISDWLINIITSEQSHEGALTPLLITSRLVEYSVHTTKPSRDFLEDVANEHKRLPADAKQFPGKMDHCTCAAFRVGTYQQ
jgi:serine/threonine protein phosphatase PrpC